jgi:hypothetical protein
MLEDHPGDVLRGGVELQRDEDLARGAQRRRERIVPVQEEPVIDALVQEGAQGPLDGVEVGDHALRIQLLRAQRDARHAVVAVQPAALAGVVEQPVAVAE